MAAANGILAFFAFLEIIWILSRARNGKKFMENRQFYADHLKSNSNEHCQARPEEMSVVEPQPPAVNMPGNAETTLCPPEHPALAQAPDDFCSAIQTLKEDCLRRTEQLSDLKQPFRRPNPGAGPKHEGQAQPEEMPLVEPQPPAVNTPGNTKITLSPPEHPEPIQAPNDFASAIQTLKEDCLRGTEQLSDLKQPFRRPNPGEGPKHDLKIDEIYVNVAIHEGRVLHDFAKERREQLKTYPPNAKDCHFAKLEDIVDKKHANVLVVGCLLYTSPSPRDLSTSRMPSSA